MSACPRCGGALWARELPQGSGHACGTCGGVWLDTAAASHITRVLCSETLAHAEAGARIARHPVDTRGAIACPTCGAAAQRSLAGQARVEIDVCPAHGTWFDRNELERVAQAHAAARAYGSAVVAGAAAGGAALMAAQPRGQGVDAADVAEIAVEGGSAALEVGSALGDAADAADVAGTVFELLGGLFEGLG
ncbi:MAG: zf-TFIIB domain-containing protein [Polyangiaceae bacterium]|nr:zf-TFIIB domain-containing protein [Polyangiaceae bacterium]